MQKNNVKSIATIGIVALVLGVILYSLMTMQKTCLATTRECGSYALDQFALRR